MKDFFLNLFEKHYATVLFSVEDKLLMVKHWRGSVIKIFGGTYNGSLEGWADRGDTDEYYDNRDKKSIFEKIRKTLVKVFGGIVEQSTLNELTMMLVEKFGNEPTKIHAVVEMVEEVGLIPIELTPFHEQKRGIKQFFFTCSEAFAFSKDKNAFVLVRTQEDLPENGRDYLNQDDDVENVVLVPINELTNTEKWNFAHSHREALRNFSIKNFTEKDK